MLKIASDADVARAEAMLRAVRRDIHKMKAFVRFRSVALDDDAEVFVAWFEPEHHILGAAAPFFMRRFAGMRWSILTPEASAHWDGTQLRFGPGGCKVNAPREDALEETWRRYYRSIFNPARLKPKAMQAEMPKKYWKNLPEASLIAPLLREAGERTREMLAATPLRERLRSADRSDDEWTGTSAARTAASLQNLRAFAQRCRGCALHGTATQTVFGEGPRNAPLMIVGEQPGDEEDLAGRPFVGPAGRLLDAALTRADLDRTKIYVTNAVKHFKFEPRGKRRLHETP